MERRDVEEVESVEGYEAVVLGSAVYAGQWMKEAREFVRRHQAALAKLPVWLFSSGPLGDDPKPEGDPKILAEVTASIHPRGHRNFTGKLDREALGLGERLVVKAVRAPYGDYRDWEEIRGWAHEIAADLTRAPGP